MSGSVHFQIYERNLRRIMLLDWLRDESIRRRTALAGLSDARAAAASGKPPYWMQQADALANG